MNNNYKILSESIDLMQENVSERTLLKIMNDAVRTRNQLYNANGNRAAREFIKDKIVQHKGNLGDIVKDMNAPRKALKKKLSKALKNTKHSAEYYFPERFDHNVDGMIPHLRNIKGLENITSQDILANRNLPAIRNLTNELNIDLPQERYRKLLHRVAPKPDETILNQNRLINQLNGLY